MTTPPTSDWRLVAAKELHDLLGRLGRKPLTRTLGVVAVFGILVPLQFRGAGNLPAFFAVFMAFLPARLVAIESFAGERERGTLESLLALPLTDRGIALGKIVAATVYGAARGWLFVVVWAVAAGALHLTGLVTPAVPGLQAVVLTLVASVFVAAVAAVFGVWQSAAAPSVRAIVESGGVLRLIIIVMVFFVGPWLLGLLSPGGQAPSVTLPGGARTVSVDAVVVAALANPGVVVALAAGVALVTLVAAIALFRDTLRRCRREALAMVGVEAGRSG